MPTDSVHLLADRIDVPSVRYISAVGPDDLTGEGGWLAADEMAESSNPESPYVLLRLVRVERPPYDANRVDGWRRLLDQGYRIAEPYDLLMREKPTSGCACGRDW